MLSLSDQRYASARDAQILRLTIAATLVLVLSSLLVSLYLLGIAVGLGFVFLSLRRPHLPLLCMFALAPANELQRVQEIPFVSLLRALGIVACISWAGTLLRAEHARLRILWSSLSIPLVWFGIAILVAGNAVVYSSRSGLILIAQGMSYLLLIVVMADLVRDAQFRRRLLLVFFAVSGAVAVLTLYQFVSGNAPVARLFGLRRLQTWGAASLRAVGTAAKPNQGAALFLLVIPLAWAFYLESRHRLASLYYLAVSGLASLALLATQSRSAYLGVAFQALFMVVATFKRRTGKWLRAGGVALVGLLLISPWLKAPVLRGIQMLRGDVTQRRVDILHTMADVVTTYPWFGVPLSVRGGEDFPNAHNIFFSLMVEGGLFQLIPYLWLTGGAVWLLWRLSASRLELHSLVCGFIAVIGGYHLHGLFHVSHKWSVYWMILALAISLLLDHQVERPRASVGTLIDKLGVNLRPKSSAGSR